jgi:ElaB/YqjD/DUF883 family membrane-anchored ribosome-binding protein
MFGVERVMLLALAKAENIHVHNKNNNCTSLRKRPRWSHHDDMMEKASIIASMASVFGNETPWQSILLQKYQ